jgi:hypothetical protein
MEKTSKIDFSCDNDFERVHDFLSKTYSYEGIHNWDTARWSFNRYCTHNQEEFSNNRIWERSVKLWENVSGEIVAVAHIEEPGDYFFQVHPDFKYLVEEMLLWSIDDCKKRYPNLNKIVVTSSNQDFERKQLYNKYGAVKHDFIDENRVAEIKKEYLLPRLPNGYKLINMDGENLESCKTISDLYTYIWPSSTYMPNGETVSLMTSSIAFKKELSFIIVNDKEQYVAFTVAWIDSINKMAHFYPIAVNPDYLDTNVLEYMLNSALNTLSSLGYEKATLGAWYSDEENKIFETIGFIKDGFEEIYDISF